MLITLVDLSIHMCGESRKILDVSEKNHKLFVYFSFFPQHILKALFYKFFLPTAYLSASSLSQFLPPPASGCKANICLVWEATQIVRIKMTSWAFQLPARQRRGGGCWLLPCHAPCVAHTELLFRLFTQTRNFCNWRRGSSFMTDYRKQQKCQWVFNEMQ